MILLIGASGPHLSGLQRLQSWCSPARTQPRIGVGNSWNPREHHFTGLHRNSNGRSVIRAVSREEAGLAHAEYAWETVDAGRIQRCGCLLDLRRQLVHDRLGFEDRWRTLGVVIWLVNSYSTRPSLAFIDGFENTSWYCTSSLFCMSFHV